MLADLDAFTGPGAEQEDDITMVTLERSAGAGRRSASPNGSVLAEFELPSEPGNEREAIARVAQAVGGARASPMRALERLKTAVGEATMNAMEHGNEYRRRPARSRSSVLHGRGQRCASRSRDRGGGARRCRRRRGARPGGEAGRLSRSPRGWGLFLIEKMVDEARVTGEGGERTLELVLRLEGGDDGDT